MNDSFDVIFISKKLSAATQSSSECLELGTKEIKIFVLKIPNASEQRQKVVGKFSLRFNLKKKTQSIIARTAHPLQSKIQMNIIICITQVTANTKLNVRENLTKMIERCSCSTQLCCFGFFFNVLQICKALDLNKYYFIKNSSRCSVRS